MIDSGLLDAILKGSKHRLNLFRQEEVQDLEKRLTEKDGKYFAECLVRKKQIQLKPEEVVRQLLLARLNKHYGYSFDNMSFSCSRRSKKNYSFRSIFIFFGIQKTIDI